MMPKHRALVVGAGRIGAGFRWHDDAYTHAGAIRALSDRVELVGFVEPDNGRAAAAYSKWGVPVYHTLREAFEDGGPRFFDVVSICVQPDLQSEVISQLPSKLILNGIWCEKPWMGTCIEGVPMQINYLRRADPWHRRIAGLPDIRCNDHGDRFLFVTAKDDEHTRCHFEDLARWWGAKLVYTPIDGPCSYFIRFRDVTGGYTEKFFSMGGVNAAECMKGMLENLIDHIDRGAPLHSPHYMETPHATS
jgi:hypothetical protein